MSIAPNYSLMQRSDYPGDGCGRCEVIPVLESERNALAARVAELERDLEFVERWAVHHAAKPNITQQEVVSMIRNYPAIAQITRRYADGDRGESA